MYRDSLSLPALATLAAPDRAVVAALAEQLRTALEAAGGVLGFADFMERVLYTPDLGYYVRDAATVGAGGDFVTAPELGPLFAQCLAQPCTEVLAALGGGVITEIGAGSGVMARDLLLALAEQRQLPDAYRIVERSPALRDRQRQTLAALPEPLVTRVQWCERVESMHGVILANEVLDALAVERFLVTADGPQRLGVGWSGEQFEWRAAPADAALRAFYAELSRELPHSLPPGYRSEWCPGLETALAAFTDPLERGVVLFADYGYPRAEYYHPQRLDGTLLCHYEQRVHADPFQLLGLQDLTASVDFTAVARAAARRSLEVAGYCSQTWFLLGCGIEASMARSAAGNGAAALATAAAARRLLLPGEMGERIQVLCLTRDMPGAPACFGLRDQRPRLQGTSGYA